MADNIGIKDGLGVAQTMRTTNNAGVHTPHHHIASSGIAYDSIGNAFVITGSQKKFRDSFVGSTLDATKWDSAIGTGGAITVGSGVLTLGSGTTTSSETYVLSKEQFTIPFKAAVGITLSQRIANQSFIVEAVSVNNATGLPDGLHTLAFLWDGTTATQGKYRVQNSGATALDSSAVTLPTTASGSYYEIEAGVDEAWFHGGTLDSTTARTNSYRRHQQIPDPNAVFKIRLRWLNGGSAPASNTNAVCQYITVYDHTEIPVEISGSRGMNVAAQASAVQVTGGSVTVSGTVTANAGTGTRICGGVAAHDAAISGNPIRLAGRALSANYTTVATGDTADLITTLVGAIIQKPFAIPELDWSYSAASGGIVNTTDVVVASAAGAGLRRYLTSFDLYNNSATATEFVIKDGSSTVLWRGYLPANCPNFSVQLSSPLRTTANTAMNVACITTGAAVYFNGQGYTAP